MLHGHRSQPTRDKSASNLPLLSEKMDNNTLPGMLKQRSNGDLSPDLVSAQPTSRGLLTQEGLPNLHVLAQELANTSLSKGHGASSDFTTDSDKSSSTFVPHVMSGSSSKPSKLPARNANMAEDISMRSSRPVSVPTLQKRRLSEGFVEEHGTVLNGTKRISPPRNNGIQPSIEAGTDDEGNENAISQQLSITPQKLQGGWLEHPTNVRCQVSKKYQHHVARLLMPPPKTPASHMRKQNQQWKSSQENHGLHKCSKEQEDESNLRTESVTRAFSQPEETSNKAAEATISSLSSFQSADAEENERKNVSAPADQHMMEKIQTTSEALKGNGVKTQCSNGAVEPSSAQPHTQMLNQGQLGVDDGSGAVINRVLRSERVSLSSLDSFYRHSAEAQAAFSLAVEQIVNATESLSKIVVSGYGQDGQIAQKIAAMMSSLSVSAIFSQPNDAARGEIDEMNKVSLPSQRLLVERS